MSSMKKSKARKLKEAGWKVGPVQGLLNLTPEEAVLIELKLALAEGLRKRRVGKGLTQAELASLIQSSQSRVAKMEGSDPSVTLDLLVKGLLVLGTSPKDLARMISSLGSKKAA